jgi:hypothetical protein
VLVNSRPWAKARVACVLLYLGSMGRVFGLLSIVLTAATAHAAHVPVRVPYDAVQGIDKLPAHQRDRLKSALNAQSHNLHALHALTTHKGHGGKARLTAPVAHAPKSNRMEATPENGSVPKQVVVAPSALRALVTPVAPKISPPATTAVAATPRNERTERALLGGLVKIDKQVATNANGSIVRNEKNVTVGPFSFHAGRADEAKPANAKQQAWPIVDPGVGR